MPSSWEVRVLLSLALTCLAAQAARSQHLSGYVKNFTLGFKLPDANSAQSYLWQSANRVRFKYKQSLPGNFTFDGAWEILPRFQSQTFYQSEFFPFVINPTPYRVADFPAQIYPGDDQIPGRFALSQNLDRLSLFWKTSKADIIVGRQPVAWGSARVVNPTDIIAPFAFNELDKEEVFGVDVLRVRIPTGSLSEVDLGYLPGRGFSFDKSAFFARGRSNVWQTDGTVMAIGFQRNLLLGLDLSRSVGPAGLNFDAAYVIAGALGEPESAGADYLRISVGVDGSPKAQLYLYAEYHYNSAGGRTPGDYGTLFGTIAYREGNVYLLGRHYLTVGGNLQITPLNTINWLAMVNLGDRSLDLWPSWEYNLTANMYLSAGLNVGSGKSPIPQPAPAPPIFRSEFGAYPRIFYLSLRYYF